MSGGHNGEQWYRNIQGTHARMEKRTHIFRCAKPSISRRISLQIGKTGREEDEDLTCDHGVLVLSSSVGAAPGPVAGDPSCRGDGGSTAQRQSGGTATTLRRERASRRRRSTSVAVEASRDRGRRTHDEARDDGGRRRTRDTGEEAGSGRARRRPVENARRMRRSRRRRRGARRRRVGGRWRTPDTCEESSGGGVVLHAVASVAGGESPTRAKKPAMAATWY
ncbi:hypothetical protein C2845_PM01G08740 [Panicum miliaceum]|uniref:Uncharacterized protein n=1 Tax=Panicum miliaceum TaxID=4540 RepID=A0A3L6TPT6_PANMI|nr:hypothetical protein C2845_PM01G08740 [Panicum miliaceum]